LDTHCSSFASLFLGIIAKHNQGGYAPSGFQKFQLFADEEAQWILVMTLGFSRDFFFEKKNKSSSHALAPNFLLKRPNSGRYNETSTNSEVEWTLQ
jgi:hypothetical protein